MKKNNQKNITFFIVIFFIFILAFFYKKSYTSNLFLKIYHSIRYDKINDYPNKFVKVEVRLYKDSNLEIEKFQIGSNKFDIENLSSNEIKKVYLNLRPGDYTLKWWIKTKTLLESNRKLCKNKFKINRYDKWINIVLKGSNSYIK
ncbi:MAG: hypothetical protein K1060chlam5_00299 [Candidatus Anoxychlamydiales bacterium]|nr:hypothetical protein [Candidatus Anoxychlamydiales bacterium]